MRVGEQKLCENFSLLADQAGDEAAHVAKKPRRNRSPNKERTIKPVRPPAQFVGETVAHNILEAMRWGAKGLPVCPFCDSPKFYSIKHLKESERRSYKCAACRKFYTPTTGTVLERTKLTTGKWLYAIFRICLSGEEIPAAQLQEELRVSYHTAHDIYHALRGSKPKTIKRRYQNKPKAWAKHEDKTLLANWRKEEDVSKNLNRTPQEIQERLEFLFDQEEEGVLDLS